jgi:hypothetical protein
MEGPWSAALSAALKTQARQDGDCPVVTNPQIVDIR